MIFFFNTLKSIHQNIYTEFVIFSNLWLIVDDLNSDFECLKVNHTHPQLLGIILATKTVLTFLLLISEWKYQK